MTKELAKFLVNASNHCGNDARLYENYSGRGMYGHTTDGVVVENPSELILNVIQYIKEKQEENNQFEIPDVSDSGQLRTDSMGRNNSIIY